MKLERSEREEKDVEGEGCLGVGRRQHCPRYDQNKQAPASVRPSSGLREAL